MLRFSTLLLILLFGKSAISHDPEILDFESPKSYKNLFTVDYVSPVFGVATFSYERLFSDGKLGLELPVSIGFKNQGNTVAEPRIWGTGLELKYYPTGQSEVAYYLGIDNQIGQLEEYYYYHNGYFAPYPEENVTRLFFAAYIKNGVTFNAFERLSIAPAFALGVRSSDSNYGMQTNIHAYGEFAMSFKF